jgi:hypothetical protein
MFLGMRRLLQLALSVLLLLGAGVAGAQVRAIVRTPDGAV